MDISAKLTEEFNLRPDHVKNILNLLDEIGRASCRERV